MCAGGTSRGAMMWIDMPGWRLLLPLVFFALIVLISPSWGAVAPWVFFALAALILVHEDVRRNGAAGNEENGSGYVSLGEAPEGFDRAGHEAEEERWRRDEEERCAAEEGRCRAEEKRQREEGQRRVAEEERVRAEEGRLAAKEVWQRPRSEGSSRWHESSEADGEGGKWQLLGGDEGIEVRGLPFNMQADVCLQPGGCLACGFAYEQTQELGTIGQIIFMVSPCRA